MRPPTSANAARAGAIVERAVAWGARRVEIAHAQYQGVHGRLLNVTPSGRVLPCHAAETIPGFEFWNVRDRPLGEIWSASPAFAAFRGTAWMRHPCRSCPRQAVDFGGCRCQALALTGDARDADPVCHLSPFQNRIADIVLAETRGPMPDSLYRTAARTDPAKEVVDD